jgi:hypothetical protein
MFTEEEVSAIATKAFAMARTEIPLRKIKNLLVLEDENVFAIVGEEVYKAMKKIMADALYHNVWPEGMNRDGMINDDIVGIKLTRRQFHWIQTVAHESCMQEDADIAAIREFLVKVAGEPYRDSAEKVFRTARELPIKPKVPSSNGQLVEDDDGTTTVQGITMRMSQYEVLRNEPIIIEAVKTARNWFKIDLGQAKKLVEDIRSTK